MSVDTQEIGDKYEEFCKEFLKKVCKDLDLLDIEGKVKQTGQSGTSWQFDLRATTSKGRIVKIECKHRKAGNALKQSEMGGIVYSVKDTDSESIVITNRKMQSGAWVIADSENVRVITLIPGTNPDDYHAALKEILWSGMAEGLVCADELAVIVEELGDS